MKRLLPVLILSIIISAQTSAQFPQKLKLSVDSMNTELNSFLEKYHIPGAALAIVSSDSIWTGTYGLADQEKQLPVTNETIFRLGSISKTYLALAVMQLVEEGKLSLYDPVKEVIPEIEMRNIEESEYPVRIIHLLEHTSSIDDVHFNEGYNSEDIQDLPLDIVFSKNPKSRYVRWKPGEYTAYSNDAFSLLGLIVERISGQKFEEYIQDHILDWIGTSSTSYSRNELNSALFARGYSSGGEPVDYLPVLMRPSGGINSNICDLAVFVQMLLQDGSYNGARIVDPFSLQKMFYPSSSIPARQGYLPGYGSGFSSHYINGHRFFGHGGGLPDFNSIFLIKPECDLGIVLLINSNSDYFSSLIKNVVAFFELESEDQYVTEMNSEVEFNFGEITGYYSQADYGISLDRFPNFMLSGLSISVMNDSLYCKEFMGEEEILIPVGTNTYVRDLKSQETLYFFKNSDDEMMLTVQGKAFYKKDAAWKPAFERVFLVVSVIILLLFLLYSLIWGIKGLVQKLKGKEQVHISYLPRLYPLFAVLSLFACVFSLSLWFGDYNNAGNITVSSISVFVFSLLYPLFSVLALWASALKYRQGNRFEKIYLISVSLVLVCLSVFLYKYELIGLVLWSY